MASVPGRWGSATFHSNRVLVSVSWDTKPSAAPLGSNISFRIANDRRLLPDPDFDLTNLTLPSAAPWFVERFVGDGWVRVEDHPSEPTPRTVGTGENASWIWTATGDEDSGYSPLVPGLYRVRLAVDLTETRFELESLFLLR